MDKYEYRVKTEQMLDEMEKRHYKKAMEIADTIDWRKIKSASMLSTVSEIYELNGEFQKSRNILLVAFDRSPGSRKIVYRLGTLALKLNDTDAASDCYEEFVKIAPKNPNQYILKYKILRMQGAPLSEQIAALSDFKKSEYVERWAYELAKLYHEAGMTAECLEECDDLILWFSEGKYVYQAMELKMKYKPLTPLQQEKYDEYKGVRTPGIRRPVPKQEREEEPEAKNASGQMTRQVSNQTMRFEDVPKTEPGDEKDKPDGNANLDDILAGLGLSGEKTGEEPNATRRLPTGELGAAREAMRARKMSGGQKPEQEGKEPEEQKPGPDKERAYVEEPDQGVQKMSEGAPGQEGPGQVRQGLQTSLSELQPDQEQEDWGEEEEQQYLPEENKASIKTIVKGATLEEALMNGVALANGISREEKKRMEQREQQIRISGEMKIEDILQEWEEKQKVNAEAIEEQKTKDEARLQKEREELEKRREAERLEAQRREAEEVARRREAEAAAQRAAEEAEAARKAKEEEAAKKAAEEKAAQEAAARKAAEEKAARKAAEKKAARKKTAGTKAAQNAPGEDAAKKATEGKAIGKTMGKAAPKKAELSEDIRQLVEELEGHAASEQGAGALDAENGLDLLPEEIKASFDEDYNVSAAASDGIDEADSQEAEKPGEGGKSVEDGSEEGEFARDDGSAEDELEAEDFGEDESEAGDFVENEYEEEDTDEDEYEEEDFEEDELEEEDFGEDEYEEEDFEEDEYKEEDFEEDEYEEEDFGEDELEEEDFEEDEYEEEDFEEDELEEEDFDEEDELEEEDFDEEDELEEEDFGEEDGSGEEDFDEDGFEDEFEEDELPEIAGADKDAPLEIEEPSEEEIQKRIKKGKGKGVPFDTGFVVTGRYDLSATSEIGLKAGLTEEQKKLFSYFVPVRGMSEQIVEVLDNDRRARREGTSKTGNLLVIGRKGSGKTVLAVDIVKAIQKQRNLKQGKVAIVTGESLNKKELTNIIQKLRGGAIIVEKAGKLNSRTVRELSQLMEKKTGEMLFVLEDQRKPLERILTANPGFRKKFTSKLELPVFINDELVTFGQTYAKENGYKLDEMGILALYSRIDVMQREDHAVTVAEVKDMMDEAIEHSQKANVKHLARRMFKRGTDDADRIILKEEDFKI